MHEMGITQSIVAIVSEQAAGRKVRRVTLEIGKLAAIMPDFDPLLLRCRCPGQRARRRGARHHRNSRQGALPCLRRRGGAH